MTSEEKGIVAMRSIQGLILEIRGQKVILDSDLAALYGVPTKRLNEQVARNAERFPADFAFQLTTQEVADLRSHFATSSSQHADRQGDGMNWSQFATSSRKHRGAAYRPYAFTEHGALMAANVLRSPKAVEMSVFIVRAFVRMRGALVSQYEMAGRLDQIEKILLVHDNQLKELFETIRPLLLPPSDPPANPIGFRVREARARYAARRQRNRS